MLGDKNNQSYQYKISIHSNLVRHWGKSLFSLALFFFFFFSCQILISMAGIEQTGRMAAKYFGLFTASLAAASTTTSMVLPDFDAPTIVASIMGNVSTAFRLTDNEVNRLGRISNNIQPHLLSPPRRR